ncbi:MAG: hypothetical protein NVSMB19_22370 [Vulcanimicrobiaceae bacterium]
MADGSGTETYANHTNSTTLETRVPNVEQPGLPGDDGVRRALIFVGIAAASAGIAYAIVRATLARPPADPTTERIQQLIDEANRLLKQLDDKKPD